MPIDSSEEDGNWLLSNCKCTCNEISENWSLMSSFSRIVLILWYSYCSWGWISVKCLISLRKSPRREFSRLDIAFFPKDVSGVYLWRFSFSHQRTLAESFIVTLCLFGNIVCRAWDNPGGCWQIKSNLWACDQSTPIGHARSAVESLHRFRNWARGIRQHKTVVQKITAKDTTCQSKFKHLHMQIISPVFCLIFHTYFWRLLLFLFANISY